MPLDRAVLVRYSVAGKPKRGSGIRVGGEWVLTADHCARGADHTVVADGLSLPATVYVRTHASDAKPPGPVDLAVLQVPGLAEVPPLPCIRVERTRDGRLAGCDAVGFPTWKDDEAGPRTAQASGYIPPREGRPAGGVPGGLYPLTLKVTDPQALGHPTPSGRLEGSVWEGMSGAGVLIAGRLVGVVASHVLSEGQQSLTVASLDLIETADAEAAGKFWKALGDTGQAALPVARSAEVSGPPTCREFVDRLMTFINVHGKTMVDIYRSGAVAKTTLFDWKRQQRMPAFDQLKRVVIACAPEGTDGASFWAEHGPGWEHYWRRVTAAEHIAATRQTAACDGHGVAASPVTRSRQSVLIVEDEIGEQLRSLLGDFGCTIVRSLDEFWAITPRIDEFDAALVDLHLKPERLDQEGIQVLEWLAGHSSVPTVAMTSQTPEDVNVGNLISRYNLAEYCSKSRHLGAVVQAVRRTLSEAGQADLVGKIETELIHRERRARTRLARRGADDGAYETLERDLELVREACRTSSLRSARNAQRSFDEKYGLLTA